MGAHQKIDKIARRHLAELLGEQTDFPKFKAILHFEGRNGPDGIKLKSPAKNEPWHFFDPLSKDTKTFMNLIAIHYNGLVKELKAKNHERAAFEAAWLAHAAVDGMTPAHQYPFKEKIADLRSGADNSTRTSYKKKLIFGGTSKWATIRNMLKAYGPKGVYVAHVLFEAGFTFIIRPLRFPDARPKREDIILIKKMGSMDYYLSQAKLVAHWDMFENYIKNGWKSKLVREVREDLAPLMIKTVTVLWYQAAIDAGIVTNKAPDK
jgi:hypothetical protein